MKTFKIVIPIFLLLIPFVLFAQNNFTHLCKMGIGDVADEDPGLFIFMMLMLCVMGGAFMIGAIVMVLLLCLLSAFIIGGTISMSFFVGFYNRSITKGFKFFMVVVGILMGSLTGIVASFFAKAVFDLHLSSINFYFLLAGGVGGALVALASSAALKMTYRFLKGKLKAEISLKA